MNIITPITITDAMIGAGTTVPEDATATAWASGGTYAVGDYRHLASTHRVYRCAVATTGSSTPPNLDITHWVDDRPTTRWAPFDTYTSTAATATGSMTYVLSPGYFNAVALYGLVGDSYTLTVRDAPGGTVIFTQSGNLVEDPAGWYEYLFSPVKPLTNLVVSNIPLSATAQLTLTLTSATGGAVAMGMLVVGDFRSLLSGAEWGGPQRGSSAEPISYSYINTADDGTITIRRRHKATNLRVNVLMPVEVADYAMAAIQEVLDVPIAVITSTSPRHRGLTTFGLLSGSVSYDGATATLSATVKGLI